jgi:hypothetical protein
MGLGLFLFQFDAKKTTSPSSLIGGKRAGNEMEV